MVEEKIGRKINFTKPIKMGFEVECEDTKLAIAIALDYAKNKYPDKDWSKAKFNVEEYIFKEVKW